MDLLRSHAPKADTGRAESAGRTGLLGLFVRKKASARTLLIGHSPRVRISVC